MYSCSEYECNTVREPVCGRGGPVTAASVTGTGPGAACKPEAEEAAPPAPPRKLGCRISVVSSNRRSYVAGPGAKSIQVC